MRAKKSLGQHFLIHPRIAERIVLTAGLSSRDTVLEIGPGKGILTRILLAQAARVVAVEADKALFDSLQSKFATEIEEGRLELVHEDIRAFGTSTLPQGYAVVANIPYYLTGELFRMFLGSSHQPRSMTLLVQKEVAERVARSKKESILSLSVKAFGTPKYEFTVPKGAFIPPPKVDSALLSIREISRKNFRTPAHEEKFFELLHAGFAHKRKFVESNLGFRSERIPEKARAEDLSLTDWLALISERNRP